MPVNTKHIEYEHQEDIWKKCRDVVEGQEKIHLEGPLYLPKLSGQTDKEYQGYVSRTLFYNATQRTVDAMSGLLFRKDPVISYPASLENIVNNIDLKGNHIDVFVEDIADEVLTVGRYGLLIEYPEFKEGVITQADAQRQNQRAFFVKYRAEDIINWQTTVVNNQKVLSRVVLREYETVQSDKDEFDLDIELIYRVLDLNEGNYRQRVYKANDEQENLYVVVDEKYPLKGGSYINEIPFVPITAKGNEIEMQKSPIIDLLNVNISHYKTTADLEHGAHFTGLPTAVVTGHSLAEGETLKIGSSTAWVFSEAEADAKYLEFAGSGLDALEKRLDKKEQQMATLGARMLANEKAMAETAESHIIKRQGENSALASIAQAIADGVTQALKILSDWESITGDIEYKINKDFIPIKMQPQEIVALLQAWQSQAISFNDLVDNFQRGEIIDSERTAEDIKADLEIEGPGSFGGQDGPERQDI